MKRRIVMVAHMPSRPKTDRVQASLSARGYELDWRYVAEGEPLPEDLDSYAATVIYGGSMCVRDAETTAPYLTDELRWIDRWAAAEKPLLGICLGAQLLAHSLGGRVDAHPDGLKEIGFHPVTPTASANGFLPSRLHMYQWHGDGFEAPRSAELLATGETFAHQAFRYAGRLYGIQFHPEVTPVIMERWMNEASEMMASPGAHDPERQRSDSQRHDAAMALWLEQFLDGWLAEVESELATAV